MTRRFEQAAELRGFAKELREIRFRGSERYLEDIDELAGRMAARADQLVRQDEPRAESVFRAGHGRAANGARFRAEVRRPRAAA